VTSAHASAIRVATLVACLGVGPLARADDVESTAAQTLFDEAKKLMASGRYAEACPKLEASQRIEPALGTLLNLADCDEKRGQLASSWARFLEAAAQARAEGHPDAELVARDRAAQLAARLPKSVLQTPGAGPSNARAGDAPSAVAPLTSASVDDGHAAPRLGSQEIGALVAGGVGLAAVIFGTVEGLRSISKHNEAEQHCDAGACRDAAGVELRAQARSAGTLATVAFVVGAVGLATGGVLWFTAEPSAAAPVQAGVGFRSVTVRGQF
jgi:hypothetical protein